MSSSIHTAAEFSSIGTSLFLGCFIFENSRVVIYFKNIGFGLCIEIPGWVLFWKLWSLILFRKSGLFFVQLGFILKTLRSCWSLDRNRDKMTFMAITSCTQQLTHAQCSSWSCDLCAQVFGWRWFSLKMETQPCGHSLRTQVSECSNQD